VQLLRKGDMQVRFGRSHGMTITQVMS
jgi:hypothetical protein